MHLKNFVVYLAVLVISTSWMACRVANQEKTGSQAATRFETWKRQDVPSKNLAQWRFLGIGRAFATIGNQTCLEEAENSEGVMLLSPDSYGKQVIVRYQFLLLSPAAIVVTLLSARNKATDGLTIPADYNGAMNFWTGSRENYFFVFRNAPHGGTPYITRNPGARVLTSAPEQDGLLTGIYYNVEVGQNLSRIWVAINGKTVLEADDSDTIPGGRVALRVRGSADYKAAVLFKNLVIYSKP
ncbi:hypothetical protein DUE52_22135 [Larkinella punicea]|uniref:DUF1080 domain-containing protein n=2 Tax=Larkinella punicea TaxID=2315727 RepID=A0A368JIL1_9BACT|nr:hypothetical protein DUE52_22135 [Larkinella punicea]